MGQPTTKAGREARRGFPKKPSFDPTPEQKTMVELYIAFGTLHDDIRVHIRKKDGNPISLRTFYNKFKNEIMLGASKANGIVAGKLFTAAKEGNITAQIFWLKTRAKWYENAPREPNTQVADTSERKITIIKAEDLDEDEIERINSGG